MSVSNNKKQNEKSLHRALALEAAKGYCRQNGLSIEKLLKQRFYVIYDEAYFAQSSDVVPNGLLNDLDTLPKPTLIIKAEGDSIQFEQTEYTKQYLAM